MRWSRIFSRGWIATTMLAIAGAAVCVRLGIWQLDRLAQRQAFNSHVLEMRALPMLQLPSTEDLEAQEYRRVRVRGTFDPELQVAIRNQAHDGQYGFRLVSPLRIDGEPDSVDGAPAAVLVDRGWIPAQGNEQPDDWRKYDEPGMVEVRGVIRLGQTGPIFGGITQPTPVPGELRAMFWVYADVAGIGKQLPYAIVPVYVQSDGTAIPGILPIAGTPMLELTEGPHRGYAMQWFAFAAILLIGYPIYVGKREHVHA
jgi:surfeit locus 1 family protein